VQVDILRALRLDIALGHGFASARVEQGFLLEVGDLEAPFRVKVDSAYGTVPQNNVIRPGRGGEQALDGIGQQHGCESADHRPTECQGNGESGLAGGVLVLVETGIAEAGPGGGSQNDSSHEDCRGDLPEVWGADRDPGDDERSAEAEDTAAIPAGTTRPGKESREGVRNSAELKSCQRQRQTPVKGRSDVAGTRGPGDEYQQGKARHNCVDAEANVDFGEEEGRGRQGPMEKESPDIAQALIEHLEPAQDCRKDRAEETGILPRVAQQRLEQLAWLAIAAEHRGHDLAIGKVFAAQKSGEND